MNKNRLQRFLFPALSRRYMLRVVLVAAGAFLFFGYVCIPFRIQGHSMAPTYENGAVNFCFALRYLFSDPSPPDVVAVRLAGTRVMLLKRVVATKGQAVAFRNGFLFVDGRKVAEPYVEKKSDWSLPSRTVKPGHVYVVGDNRSVPIENHQFGQTPTTRIVGVPLW
ncbi:signal peptidase I [Desulfosudis oleivorans]|uniref:Signal peptidase I n=1 Tax=Desulfosudis oleivorans (strain DSM 6200 / JCM 39069 / Hxd3) TaxID=96561 RepID=A8ZSW7_DESOH|nr:signal peptidase I [Desulfosudis oleivorans]ABW66131.1 signal peptidase I [Desulfosudis oleivorans Hxd3]